MTGVEWRLEVGLAAGYGGDDEEGFFAGGDGCGEWGFGG
jgi:hypothetical protein